MRVCYLHTSKFRYKRIVSILLPTQLLLRSRSLLTASSFFLFFLSVCLRKVHNHEKHEIIVHLIPSLPF